MGKKFSKSRIFSKSRNFSESRIISKSREISESRKISNYKSSKRPTTERPRPSEWTGCRDAASAGVATQVECACIETRLRRRLGGENISASHLLPRESLFVDFENFHILPPTSCSSNKQPISIRRGQVMGKKFSKSRNFSKSRIFSKSRNISESRIISKSREISESGKMSNYKSSKRPTA